MNPTRTTTQAPGTDGAAADALLKVGRFLRKGEVSADLRTLSEAH